MITRKRQRPRWEVRRYAWNVLAASCGLPCTPQLMGTSTWRWRWMAYFVAFFCHGKVAGIAMWADVVRQKPKLRVLNTPQGATAVSPGTPLAKIRPRRLALPRDENADRPAPTSLVRT